MKKLLLAAAAIILSVSAFANIGTDADTGDHANPAGSTDEKSEALLGALAKKVAAWGDYRVEFTVAIGNQTLAGSYEVSGESYHVVTPELELFCDGATKYEVNPLDREVAIDRVDPNDRTVMGNPTKLFDFLDGSYSRRYIGPALIGGVNCERIELTESELVAGRGAAQTIDVYLSTATGLPVRVGYTIGFMSTEAAVDVVRITPQIALGAGFRYDQARYSGYEIIDFR